MEEVGRGDTPRLEMSNGRTDADEEESKGGGRGQGSLARSHAPSLSRPPDRLYANRNRRLARSFPRCVATGGRRKVLKQGKECPRQWRGRPRPPTAAGQRHGGEDISWCCHRLRRLRCFLFLLFLGKGNGGAKRSFITREAAAAAARTTTARPTDRQPTDRRPAFFPPTSSTGLAAAQQW